MVVVALGVLDQRAVNVQSVTGAVCVYLLLGLLFVFLYSAVGERGHGTCRAPRPAGAPAHRRNINIVLEALIGQLYLVTVVAVLVSRIGARPSRE